MRKLFYYHSVSCFTLVLLTLVFANLSHACTGITLQAKDGSLVYGRTMEWGTFDLKSRILVMPRGYKYRGTTPEGLNGIEWTGKYGVAGLDALEKPIYADAMNETGLSAGLFYHPNYAEYKEYNPFNASKSMSPTDVMQYILSNFSSVDEVKKGMSNVEVVAVIEDVLGFPAPIHILVSEPSGKQLVIEWDKGEIQFFDAPLGVITNAPKYDWHITNLKNYINLSPVALPTVTVEDIDFSPLGGGSGMIGLPGDFTPPSRFVRAVAFSQTARPTTDGLDTTVELFRILDNFNVPLGAAEGNGSVDLDGMLSSTIWTVAQDTKNKVIYYHTQHNRQIRKFDVNSINFDTLNEVKMYQLDDKKEQNIKDSTPR